MGLKLSKKAKPEPTRPLSMLESIEAAEAKGEAARQRKLARVMATGQIGKPLIMTIWQTAFKRCHSEHPCVMKEKDLDILKGHLRGIAAAKIDPQDYLEWVVSSWARIMGDKFSWMTEPPAPAYPQIRMLVRFADRFQDAFADRERIDRMASMTAREKLIETRKRKGMDVETAERDLEEKGAEKKIATVSTDAIQRRQRIRQREEQARQITPARKRVRPQTTGSDGSFGAWKD